MRYVYLLRSEAFEGQRHIGIESGRQLSERRCPLRAAFNGYCRV